VVVFLWTTAIAVLLAASKQTIDFVVNPTIRSILDWPSVLIFAAFLVFLVALAIGLIVTLVRRRFRTALSLACALAVVPLLLVGTRHLFFCNLYYWYVLFNQTQFETAARKASPPPTFAVLETRDVSTGLVINPNIFASIVDDETSQLGVLPAERSSQWQNRNRDALQQLRGSNGDYAVEHLHGHFS
jgi:hypothetical protein